MNNTKNRSSNSPSSVPQGREQELKKPTSVTGAGETSVPRMQADGFDSEPGEAATPDKTISSAQQGSEEERPTDSQGV